MTERISHNPNQDPSQGLTEAATAHREQTIREFAARRESGVTDDLDNLVSEIIDDPVAYQAYYDQLQRDLKTLG